jgi:hypothetical protein
MNGNSIGSAVFNELNKVALTRYVRKRYKNLTRAQQYQLISRGLNVVNMIPDKYERGYLSKVKKYELPE